MKRYTKSLLAMLLVCFLAGCSPGGTEGEAKTDEKQVAAGETYYFGARIIPGDGSPAIENGVFLVQNGKITALGKEGDIKPPRESGRVEMKGLTITPVFVNLHAHPGLAKGPIVSPENYTEESVMASLQRYAYYGVEAVVAMGSDKGDIAFRIRDEQREGKRGGARLYTAGRGIAPRGGGPDIFGDIPIEVSTEAEARRAVADEAERKVDAINIWVDDFMGKSPKMRPEIYRAVIDEAHKNNLKVFAHVFYLADAKELVNAGVDGLVNSIRDREVDDELIAAMKSKNVFLSPTLTAHEAKFIYAERPDWLGEQLMREAYPAQLSAYLADPVTMNRFRRNPELPALKRQYEIAGRNLKKLSDAGVMIALGTDSGSADTYPGYFEIREMMLMAGAGMSPEQVITAATSVPANIIGADDIGTFAVGKNADFLTFPNNPAEKIENVMNLRELYLKGAEVERSTMIQDIKVEVPRITDADRQRDAAAQAEAARIAAEAKLPHYGKFVLGAAANTRGLSIPVPRGGKSSVQAGPPARVTVSLRATAGELSQFYREAMPAYNFKAAGGCWEKQTPAGKLATLCVETQANSAVIQIAEK